MPSLKLSGVKSQEVKTGFESFDGPTPTQRGFYRALIKQFKIKKFRSGSLGFYIVVEFEAAKGDPKKHKKFDGFPMFIQNIIVETADGSPLKEGSIKNLQNLLAAIGAPDEPNLVYGKGDLEEGIPVTKVGTVNPVGKVVNIDLGFEAYGEEQRPSSNGIFKYKDGPAFESDDEDSDDEDAEDDSDIMEETEDDEEIDEEYEARAEELEALTIVPLRKIAKDLEIDTAGLKKDALVEAILDAEYPEEDDADEDEDEDEEDEDDEEDDDEDEEAEREARETELADFDRTKLKSILRELLPDRPVKKSETDDDLRNVILEAEFNPTPF